MSRRTLLFAAALALWALACPATPAGAGLLPDIRGTNFGASLGSFQGVEVFGGPVTIPGLGTTFFEDNPTRAPALFDPSISARFNVPTFSVVADPGNPNDPTRIDIQTRFSTGTTTPSNEVIFWNLIGSYDRTTGVISVSGSKSGPTGSILLDDGEGINLFGNGQNFEVILGFTSLTYSLHGTLMQAPNGLTINGTDPVVPLGGPGNIGISGTTFVYFNPPNDFNIADALLTSTVASGQGYGGLYNWSATTVPEPASVVLLAIGVVGILALRRRRTRPGCFEV